MIKGKGMLSNEMLNIALLYTSGFGDSMY